MSDANTPTVAKLAALMATLQAKIAALSVGTLVDPYKGRIPYLVFPITKIKTFPAISYKWALTLPMDKNFSSMESA
jgi:hypothetical protein